MTETLFTGDEFTTCASSFLPKSAVDKFNALLTRHRESVDLRQSSYFRAQKERSGRLAQASLAVVMMRQASLRPSALDDHEPYKDLLAEQAAAEASATKLWDEHERYDELANQSGTMIRGLRDYIVKISKPVAAFASPSIEAPASADFPALVAAARERLESARAARRAALAAPIMAVAAKAIMRDQIEALAERGRPDVFPILESRQPAKFSTIGDLHRADTVRSTPVLDSEATLAWLHKEALIAALEREIDDAADDSEALDDEQRARRVAAAEAAMLAAERDEEAAISAAAAIGFYIPRRPDADARAVLGLADSAPKPQALRG